MISLSKRLQTIVDYIHASVLADIGCDHGYVCVQAVESKKVNKAYACDIAQGPLDNAKKVIQENHLENQIECVLMNGMENLQDDVDCVVISGMGAELIVQIVSSAISKIQINTQCIFCPHKDMDVFYRFLAEYGFEIIEQTTIYEDKHYYHIVNCIYTAQAYELSVEEQYYGKNVVKNQAYKDYISFEMNKWERIYNQLPDDKKEIVLERMNSLKKIRI